GPLRVTPMLLACAPPQHSAQRRTVAPAFGPAEIERLRSNTLMRTRELLESLPLGETFDWVELVSKELATQMLAILFDFPWETRHNLTNWSDALGDVETMHSDEERHARLLQAFEMGAAFRQLWEEKIQ